MTLRTKASHEGYLMIDHRASPGTPQVPGGTMLEAAASTCSHCQCQVIRNPARVRARAYCPKCDAYICDDCEAIRVAAGGACVPFEKLADQYFERVVRGLPTKDIAYG